MKTCENCKHYEATEIKCPRCGELKPANKFHQSIVTFYEQICRDCLDTETWAMGGKDKIIQPEPLCAKCGTKLYDPDGGLMECYTFDLGTGKNICDNCMCNNRTDSHGGMA